MNLSDLYENRMSLEEAINRLRSQNPHIYAEIFVCIDPAGTTFLDIGYLQREKGSVPGDGKRFLESLIRIASRYDAVIRLIVLRKNRKVVALYQQLGFKRTRPDPGQDPMYEKMVKHPESI